MEATGSGSGPSLLMSFTEMGGVSRGVVGWDPEVYGGGGFVVAVLVGVLAASLSSL